MGVDKSWYKYTCTREEAQNQTQLYSSMHGEEELAKQIKKKWTVRGKNKNWKPTKQKNPRECCLEVQLKKVFPKKDK